MPDALARLLRAAGLGLAMTQAASAQAPHEVDLELVLAVDVSFSMSREEQALQRGGYVAAFRDPSVAAAIAAGPLGRIAVTYVEWGGTARQVVPWTLIDGAAATERFAAELSRQPIARLPFTSISRALAFGRTLLRSNRFVGSRRVIDLSGDGPNNTEVPAALARDRAVEEGVVVNGLPIMIRDGRALDRAYPAGLDAYYRSCVIGGSGAFLLTVSSREDWADTILKKLLREIAARPASARRPGPALLPAAAAQADAGYDCLAFEQMCRDGC